MGDGEKASLRLQFNPKVRLAFHGATITTDAGLLAFREFDDALAGIPQIKPTFLEIAPSGIPSNIIPHSKGVKCGLIRSNSRFHIATTVLPSLKSPNRWSTPKSPPWEPLLRPRNRNQSRCS